jgi:hypothetical protein
MSDYIDVLQAVNLSGKSLSTVRRAIKRVPPESVKKDGDKHLYSREVLFRELGVNIQPESSLESQLDVHEPSMDYHDELVEVLKKQVEDQQRTIAQLLERQREQNVLLNNYQQRMLTVHEPPQGKTADEKRREQWIAIACIGVLLLILGLVVWFTWYRI